jgi:hypothetical protein
MKIIIFVDAMPYSQLDSGPIILGPVFLIVSGFRKANKIKDFRSWITTQKNNIE